MIKNFEHPIRIDVILDAVFRKNGTIDDVKVIRSLGYGLDESAVDTIVTKWRFRRATCVVPILLPVNNTIVNIKRIET